MVLEAVTPVLWDVPRQSVEAMDSLVCFDVSVLERKSLQARSIGYLGYLIIRMLRMGLILAELC